jgi:DNA-binding MarR family transcriptional regulator
MESTVSEFPVPPLSDLAETTFRTMLRTHGIVERAMQPCFGRFGITGVQWGVLRNLHRAEQHESLPGLQLSDLSKRLLIRPPSIVGVVDRLRQLGLVGRVSDPSNPEVKHLTLTRKGRHLVDRILGVLPDQIQGVMAGLTPIEQAHLHRLLLKLVQGMRHTPRDDDA